MLIYDLWERINEENVIIETLNCDSIEKMEKNQGGGHGRSRTHDYYKRRKSEWGPPEIFHHQSLFTLSFLPACKARRIEAPDVKFFITFYPPKPNTIYYLFLISIKKPHV